MKHRRDFCSTCDKWRSVYAELEEVESDRFGYPRSIAKPFCFPCSMKALREIGNAPPRRRRRRRQEPRP